MWGTVQESLLGVFVLKFAYSSLFLTLSYFEAILGNLGDHYSSAEVLWNGGNVVSGT